MFWRARKSGKGSLGSCNGIMADGCKACASFATSSTAEAWLKSDVIFVVSC